MDVIATSPCCVTSSRVYKAIWKPAVGDLLDCERVTDLPRRLLHSGSDSKKSWHH